MNDGEVWSQLGHQKLEFLAPNTLWLKLESAATPEDLAALGVVLEEVGAGLSFNLVCDNRGVELAAETRKAAMKTFSLKGCKQIILIAGTSASRMALKSILVGIGLSEKMIAAMPPTHFAQDEKDVRALLGAEMPAGR